LLRFGFTASRRLEGTHERKLTRHLSKEFPGKLALQPELEFHTGGSWGGDYVIAEWLINRFPDAKHVLHLPDEPFNPDVSLLPFTEIRQYATYRARNGGIVAASEKLYGYPLYDEERMPRSGTWMTIRIARRQRKPMCVTVLEPEVATSAERLY